MSHFSDVDDGKGLNEAEEALGSELSTLKTREVRLNVLVRLLGLIFLVVGVVMAYYTATTPLLPQVAPLYYFVAVLIAVSGLLAVVVRLE